MGDDVVVVEMGVVDEGDHGVDPAGMDEEGLAQLVEDGHVDGPGRADGPDQVGLLALEDGDEPRDAAFDRFLEDDVGVLQSRLRAG
jgi:hypothetical protein